MTPRQWLGGAARVISTPLSIAAIMCAGKTDLSTRLPELLDCWQDPQIWECFRYTLFKYKIWNSSHTAFTARIFTSITHILYLSAPTWKLAATPPPPPVTVHTLLFVGFNYLCLTAHRLLCWWNEMLPKSLNQHAKLESMNDESWFILFWSSLVGFWFGLVNFQPTTPTEPPNQTCVRICWHYSQ